MASGQKLYLDVSVDWSRYGIFSARFNSTSSTSEECPMRPVADEDNIWEVTVPGVNETYSSVVFRLYSTTEAFNVRYYLFETNELQWDGSQSLYVISDGGEEGGRRRQAFGIIILFCPRRHRKKSVSR